MSANTSPAPASRPIDDGAQSAGDVPVRLVRDQLEKILASDVFVRSDRLSRFLRFVVEHVLDGNTGPLKEYVIGVRVFDKDDSFDSRLDPIVRVEAGRLRAKLREYYEGAGAADRIRIELPKRGYAPLFRHAEEPAPPGVVPTGRLSIPPNTVPIHPQAKRRGPWRWTIALSTVAVVLFGAAVHYLAPGSRQLDPVAATESGADLALAVLPLKDLSGDAADVFFADAMTEALITRLAQVRSLRVISTRSSMRFKSATQTVPEIARELDVTHVLEGSVLREADKVRIMVQLVEGRTNTHVWADSYERSAADVFALQQDVASRVAHTLARPMSRPQHAGAAPAGLDPLVLEAYAKGRYFRNQVSKEGFKKGLAYFREVIDRQPAYAPAYAGLASCYCLLGGHGLEVVAPREGMADARAAALRALELDDTLAEPHAVLGIIRTKYDWDWDGAERSFRRALDLAPSYAQGRVWYSLYLEAMGRRDEAIEEAQKARALDPLALDVNLNLAWQFHQGGRDDEAFAQLQKTLELAPGFWGVHWGLGQYYLKKANYPEAIAALRKAVDLGGGHSLSVSTLGHAYAVAGQRAEALKIAQQLQAMAREAYVSPAHIAAVFAGLGDHDASFAWLERAYEMRSRSLAWLNVAREWDGLRSDPRFASLRDRVGLKLERVNG